MVNGQWSVDLLVLMTYLIGAAGLALVAFNRYDVR